MRINRSNSEPGSQQTAPQARQAAPKPQQTAPQAAPKAKVPRKAAARPKRKACEAVVRAQRTPKDDMTAIVVKLT